MVRRLAETSMWLLIKLPVRAWALRFTIYCIQTQIVPHLTFATPWSAPMLYQLHVQMLSRRMPAVQMHIKHNQTLLVGPPTSAFASWATACRQVRRLAVSLQPSSMLPAVPNFASHSMVSCRPSVMLRSCGQVSLPFPTTRVHDRSSAWTLSKSSREATQQYCLTSCTGVPRDQHGAHELTNALLLMRCHLTCSTVASQRCGFDVLLVMSQVPQCSHRQCLEQDSLHRCPAAR